MRPRSQSSRRVVRARRAWPPGRSLDRRAVAMTRVSESRVSSISGACALVTIVWLPLISLIKWSVTICTPEFVDLWQDPVRIDVEHRVHGNHRPAGDDRRVEPAIGQLDGDERRDDVAEVVDDEHLAFGRRLLGDDLIPAQQVAGLEAGKRLSCPSLEAIREDSRSGRDDDVVGDEFGLVSDGLIRG